MATQNHWNNAERHAWFYHKSEIITLNGIYSDWSDFKEKSGIEDTATNRVIFETIQSLYGTTPLKWNTNSLVNNKLKIFIEQGAIKYQIIDPMWKSENEKLFGDYHELKMFKIGEMTEQEVADNGGYDRKMIGRQTNLDQNEILKRMQDLVNGQTPLLMIVDNIKIKIFKIAYNKTFKVNENGSING